MEAVLAMVRKGTYTMANFSKRDLVLIFLVGGTAGALFNIVTRLLGVF